MQINPAFLKADLIGSSLSWSCRGPLPLNSVANLYGINRALECAPYRLAACAALSCQKNLLQELSILTGQSSEMIYVPGNPELTTWWCTTRHSHVSRSPGKPLPCSGEVSAPISRLIACTRRVTSIWEPTRSASTRERSKGLASITARLCWAEFATLQHYQVKTVLRR